MSDAGEGLIDADSRIQERLEEIAREREDRQLEAPRDPEQARAIESLRLSRAELQRQLGATTQEPRRAMLRQAIEELDRRAAALRAAAG